MPAEGGTSPDKLSVVVFSGAFDRVHYALVMASAALSVGRPATLFFTMEACRALGRADAGGEPAWRALPAGERGGRAGDMDDDFAARGVAGYEELLSACVELGGRFLVCEMGMRAIGLDAADLRDDVPVEEAGFVTFLADASATGTVLFV